MRPRLDHLPDRLQRRRDRPRTGIGWRMQIGLGLLAFIIGFWVL